MTDNLSITQGSGTTVATDEISGMHYQKVKLVLGADDVANLASVASGSPDSGSLRVTVAGCTSKGNQNFNRPADTTAYAIGDNISNNTTAGSVTKMAFSLDSNPTIIRRVRVRKSNETVATPTIRVWLWDAAFTVGSGDNAAFAQPLQDAIGYVDVDVINAGSDDAVGWTNCDIPNFAGTVYGLLQTLTAFTPASGETFTVSIWYLNA